MHVTLQPGAFGMSGYQRYGLGDTSTVQSQIIAAAQQYGVDPNLALAVAKQESGYQQTGASGGTLTSGAGALGVMQLMPATAASLNVDPTNQQQNIQGGVKLLSQLMTQFNGNVSDALAAYNAGPGAVQKYGGVPPYAETQNYVSSILANYQSMGGSANTSGDTPDTSDQPTSILDSLSNLDFTDPTTLMITAAVIGGAALLYALA